MMIYEIPLNATPNQQFNFNINNNSYAVTIRSMATGLFVDFTVNEITLFKGLRLVVGSPMTEQFRATGLNGQLLFTSIGGEYPTYKDFATSCRLYYAES